MTIQGKRVSVELEDRVLWKQIKNGIFMVKSLYSPVFQGISFGVLMFLPKWVFCMGSLMVESFNIISAKEEGLDPS